MPNSTESPDGAEITWRFGTVEGDGGPRAVLEADGELRLLDQLLAADGRWAGEAPVSTLALLDRWDVWRPRLAELAAAVGGGAELAREGLAWLPPVVYPRKLVVVGANYRDHVEEMGADPDAMRNPYCLLKPTSTSLIGAGRPIRLPAAKAEWIDWEGELGVVIGRRTHASDGGDVLDAVAGYTPLNDVSARDSVLTPTPVLGMDWVLQKGFDSFTPAGPLITPAEFVPDPQALAIGLTVSGVVKQDSSTAQMIFGVREILEHVTSVMTLEPGDMIATGSPAGVGWGRDPRERLRAGDEVVVSVEGLGELSNPVVAAEGRR